MNFILTLAYLFFVGSISGWVLELFFRKWFSSSNPEHKWINPGFCTAQKEKQKNTFRETKKERC